MDVWLELHHKMYYESSISFVCERNEKFLILSMNVVITRDFSLIEMCRAVGVRSEGIWMSEKWHSFVSTLS